MYMCICFKFSKVVEFFIYTKGIKQKLNIPASSIVNPFQEINRDNEQFIL